MNQDKSAFVPSRWIREGVITAIAAGGFFILIGLVFAITPDLPSKISAFFNSLTTVAFPYPEGSSTSTISLLAPINSAAHSGLYTAVMQFDIGFGILQAAILGIRLFVRSPRRKIAETLDHMIFWLGAAFLVNGFLLVGTTASWFQYWAALLILVGVGLIARAIVLVIKRK